MGFCIVWDDCRDLFYHELYFVGFCQETTAEIDASLFLVSYGIPRCFMNQAAGIILP
jgi:hypothetical protein